MALKDAMRRYFEAYLAAHEREGREPRVEWLEKADPRLYSGPADSEGYVSWRPAEKTERTPLESLEDSSGVKLHSSMSDYLNSFWFLAMGGAVKDHFVELFPIVPGAELTELSQYARRYVEAHDGETRFVPIGFDANQSLLVVIDNETGAVMLADDERGSFELLATSLEELIGQLTSSLQQRR